jgi:midasin (ATPase involved in ribosome maturation)
VADNNESINDSSQHNPSSLLEALQEERKFVLEEKCIAVNREVELETKVTTLHFQVKIGCISACNRYVQNRIENDFNSGIIECKEKVDQSRDRGGARAHTVIKSKGKSEIVSLDAFLIRIRYSMRQLENLLYLLDSLRITVKKKAQSLKHEVF